MKTRVDPRLLFDFLTGWPRTDGFETLILQRHQQLISAAEGGDGLDAAGVTLHMHDRAEAVDGVSGAGEIPFAAFAGRYASGMCKMRLGRGMKIAQLRRNDGE